MCEKTIKMFDGKVFGMKVSDYGLENGYLDYYTLSKVVGDAVLNNYIFESTGFENWELVAGSDEVEDDEYLEIYQYYIVSYNGYRFLRDYTNEIIPTRLYITTKRSTCIYGVLLTMEPHGIMY